jgi:hypothetical protein
MNPYKRYERNINRINRGTPRFKGLHEAVVKWVRSKRQLNEIFQIAHAETLRKDFVAFLMHEFQTGNIRPIHAGPSTTEFKPQDWMPDIADDLVNRLVQYFETTRGQTERDMYSPVPIEQN